MMENTGHSPQIERPGSFDRFFGGLKGGGFGFSLCLV